MVILFAYRDQNQTSYSDKLTSTPRLIAMCISGERLNMVEPSTCILYIRADHPVHVWNSYMHQGTVNVWNRMYGTIPYIECSGWRTGSEQT